jgi:DNA-directed RNA polymerase subunit alpha
MESVAGKCRRVGYPVSLPLNASRRRFGLLLQQDITIKRIEEGLNYCRYQVEPLELGYGTTLGNALRRILLRSLEGVAVSRIRIDSVWHEFSTIAGVREDVTEVVLNLKRVRLKKLVDLPSEVRAHLYARGEGSGERVVRAGDVAWPAEVDVINPDQPIATLVSADAVLDMDLWVTSGRGYRGAEVAEGEIITLGEIPIDAIYTPIQRVNFVVDQSRYGQATDYDRLTLEILTDGTIEPDDALAQAGGILQNYARIFAEFTRTELDLAGVSNLLISDEIQNKPLAELGLSPRVLNALRSRGIDKVGQVLTMDPDQLLSIRNFGPRSLTELREKLAEYGYLPEGDYGLYQSSGDYLDDLDDVGLSDDETQEVAEAIASLRSDDEARNRGTSGQEG